MLCRLPDEITSEILSPALKVSDHLFSNNGPASPFATFSESTSAYLLVCKDWLRVATPLLYNVVVLRSKAQAKALSQALRVNPDLGLFIRKLRVEGGYGPAMHTILKCSPNISDIFLSFAIWATDNTSGLCEGLRCINPTRVILQEKHVQNKMTQNLTDKLSELISSRSGNQVWSHLRVVDLPYSRWGDDTTRAAQILGALAKSETVTTVIVPGVWTARAIYPALASPPLEAIQIKEAVPPWHIQDIKLEEHPKLKALLRYTEKIPPMQYVPPPSNPFFIPMETAPKAVQDSVWQRVLYFAMLVPDLETKNTCGNVPSRLPLLLVSKTFKRLALPFYYTHISLKHSTSVANLTVALQQNPALGPVICTLWGSPYFYDGADGPRPDYRELLSHTTGLVRFYGWSWERDGGLCNMEGGISWDAFQTLHQSAGSTLRDFSMQINGPQHSTPAVFGHFVALQSLDWKCHTSFDSDNDSVPTDGLPLLTNLRIWSLDPSFLTVLSAMKLPSLKHLALSEAVTHPRYRPSHNTPASNVPQLETFFQSHGSKLTEVDFPHAVLGALTSNIFKLCPHLEQMAIRFHMPHDNTEEPFEAKYFSSKSITGCSVAKISVDLDIRRNKERIAKWDAFFTAFKPDRLPKLREMQFKTCIWPTTERQIAKSEWVKWAELLLQHNVNLTNAKGVKWRPRLKGPSRARG
ncbi:hypothetical protein C8R43DRAFT_1080167 [Mycena crocata]|nr:hypothetical protein C8R43DRAFT_1080167 [Mycena crocata]